MCLLSPLLVITFCGSLAPSNGNAVIRAKAGPSEIVITTTNRLAGAIHSLTWNGKEFIDSTDHGRQLQSASNFDCGKDLVAETFNPTEAGSRRRCRRQIIEPTAADPRQRSGTGDDDADGVLAEAGREIGGAPGPQ